MWRASERGAALLCGALSTSRCRLPPTHGWLVSNQTRSSSTGPQPDDQIDFGFREVPRDAKQGLVEGVFRSVAGNYDLMNDLMSGGLHRLWKEELVGSLHPFGGMAHLDVAGGTGDVAFRVLSEIRAAEAAAPGTGAGAGAGAGAGVRAAAVQRGGAAPGAAGSEAAGAPAAGGAGRWSEPVPGVHAGAASACGAAAGAAAGPGGHVTICDINPAMLEVGRRRAASMGLTQGLSWVEGNAESLPFADDTFDAYTIAFGIRNVTDRPAALGEARRVLKRGGRFLCLEFSQVEPALLRQAYDAYSLNIIPQIGRLVAGDEDSYRYLVESIRRFPHQEEFAAMIRDAGFKAVTYENLTAGVVAIHSGFKL